MARAVKVTDVRVGGGGTVYTLTPMTDAGRAWIDEKIAAPDYAWLGRSLAVEHRYIADIVKGMTEDGLVVS